MDNNRNYIFFFFFNDLFPFTSDYLLNVYYIPEFPHKNGTSLVVDDYATKCSGCYMYKNVKK